ncbi:MAG: ZIP family metal transporter [Acidobacteria bacterium]|nr:MAG: ZIP family metal transporter [Acidobacteriota bacterium]
MDQPVLYALGSVLLVSLFSLVGLLLFWLRGMTARYLIVAFVSFSSGSLFGDAFIHLLPESVEKHGFGVSISLFVLSGIAVSFLVEKVIHWRHEHSASPDHVESFAYMNLLGDAVHNFIDGIVITAAYFLDIRVGVATTIAVLFHEIPQEMSDFAVLVHGGFSRGRALMYNFLTAGIALVGLGLTVLLAQFAEPLVTFLAPFAAGGFIYIAGADLIPQLHKEKSVGSSLMQLFFFLLGIAGMLALHSD